MLDSYSTIGAASITVNWLETDAISPLDSILNSLIPNNRLSTIVLSVAISYIYLMKYGELYSEYWSHTDRFGESSFHNATQLAQQIVRLTGGTRVLDVGSGMGALVRAFLAMGIDAQGVDVSEVAVTHSESMTPGRFVTGSILDLPFEDDAFDIVVSTDCLEHIAREDVPKALLELHRVCSKSIYLNIATRPDRDNRWHLTVESQSWWENQLFDSGFRRSPSYLYSTSYAAQGRNAGEFNFIGTKINQSALLKYPKEVLLKNRGLHMDMTRETGSRSDAHMARYIWANRYIQRGDRVLDAACGLGYGAWILAQNSAAHSVLGVDNSDYAIDYARTSFCDDQRDTLPEFALGSLPEGLKEFPDASFELIVSFETVEHLEDPQGFLAECARLLTPGGRFLASVPNDWADETGEDPNPHHLHVFDWQKLKELIATKLLVDVGVAQTADRAKNNGEWVPQVRSLTEFVPAEYESAGLAEWYLVCGIKSLKGGYTVPFTDRRFGTWHTKEKPGPIAFESTYENPWLSRVILTAGNRFKNNGNQVAEGNRLESLSKNPFDRAAGLVIVAYRLLEQKSFELQEIANLTDKIDAWFSDDDSEQYPQKDPNHVRWTVSLEYVAALLQLKIGNLQAANIRFRAVVACDFLRFSPVLGIKTIEACLRLYLLERKNDSGTANEFLYMGLDMAHKALTVDPEHSRDEKGSCPPYYWSEITRIAMLAERCSSLLFQEKHSEVNGRDLVRLWANPPTESCLKVDWADQREKKPPIKTTRTSSWLEEPPTLLNTNKWSAIIGQEYTVKARLHPAVKSNEPDPEIKLQMSKAANPGHLLLKAHAKNKNPANEGVRITIRLSDPSATVLYWDVPPTELTYKIISVPEKTLFLTISISTNLGALNSTARGTLFSIRPFSDEFQG